VSDNLRENSGLGLWVLAFRQDDGNCDGDIKPQIHRHSDDRTTGL